MFHLLKLIAVGFFIWTPFFLEAQDKGEFSGQIQFQANAFLEDEAIGATGFPQYEDEFVGGELWLNLNYKIKGFDMGVRGDFFLHSNLLNPTGSYSDLGLGRWYLRKQLGDFHLEVGHIYDQIGTGLIFRSYQERPLLIDNALYGGMVKYDLGEYWQIKSFAGKQKNLFETHGSILMGLALEGFISWGEEHPLTLVPGVGFVNRRWSDTQVDQLINTLQNYTPVDSISFYYNTFAYSIYNTLSVGPLSWYVEAAFKERPIFFDADARRLLFTGETTLGKFRNDKGSVLYSSLSLGIQGFGATVEYKRTRNFTFRADPFVSLNRGIINYLPPMTRINTFRLKSRYIPAPQEVSENAWQIELRYTLSRRLKMVQYFSNIDNGNGNLLYREVDHEWQYNPSRYWQSTFGLQWQTYNQAVFEGKTGVPMVKAWIPYVEVLRKFPKRKSVRVEAQYMFTGQDFGSWAFLLLEYNLAPKWSFSVSDMYNSDPQKTDQIHYPRVDVVYIRNAKRFSLSYIKQVEGVVCAGGICRLEPAFSGVRFSFNATF